MRFYDLVILLSGWVRVEVTAYGGERIVLAVAGPGDLAIPAHQVEPDIYSVEEAIAGMRVVATEEVQLLRIPSDGVPLLCSDLPLLRRHLARLVRETARLEVALRLRMFYTPCARLAWLLLALRLLFGERHDPGGTHPVLAPPLTQADLARWLGISDASVARIIQTWKREGLVATSYGAIALVNVRNLQRQAKWSAATAEELLEPRPLFDECSHRHPPFSCPKPPLAPTPYRDRPPGL
ncbi:Crp/Fnr family transcriptional regulator [Streptosporangium canum]|uniref:Crp/Fnr family transcriptional regulator n=1 Tax=Streptosporangium canum TaxID=324952 RepID=UPI00367A889A